MGRVLPVGLALNALLAVSAAAQGLPRCEIVTIDDDPTDNCTAKTNSDRQMVYIICLDDENGGAIEMLLYDKGEIIGFTEDDVQEWLAHVNHDGRIVRSRGIGPDERDSLNLNHQREDITMRSISTIVAVAAILGLAAVPAWATKYYFNVVLSGSWCNAGNWTPEGGPPGQDDDAVIMEGRDCSVDSCYAYARSVEVQDDARLTIEAPYFLKIGQVFENVQSVINGELCFNGEGEDVALLCINTGGVTIKSSDQDGGLLNASAADGYGSGRIGTCCASTQVLTVEDDITVKGDLWIYVHVENNGTFVVDDPNDVMKFDKLGDFDEPDVWGDDGSFDVSAGTLTFADCHLRRYSAPDWILTDEGTIHVESECTLGTMMHNFTCCDITISDDAVLWVEQLSEEPRFETTGKVTMSGGTLDIDGNFKVTTELDFSGGTMQVALDKTAEFGDVP